MSKLTGTGHTARTLFLINLVSFLAILGLFITYIIKDVGNVTMNGDALTISAIVISTFVLMAMSGTFFISNSLRKSLKADGVNSIGKTVMLIIIWAGAAFYLVMFIISTIWNSGLMGGNKEAINICQYIEFAMPLVTFVLSTVIYAMVVRSSK